jgi:hypothetical protein
MVEVFHLNSHISSFVSEPILPQTTLRLIQSAVENTFAILHIRSKTYAVPGSCGHPKNRTECRVSYSVLCDYRCMLCIPHSILFSRLRISAPNRTILAGCSSSSLCDVGKTSRFQKCAFWRTRQELSTEFGLAYSHNLIALRHSC